MKNTTRLITAGFGLMMILSLLLGGVGALADPVSAPGAPAAGPITSVTVTSPANHSILGFDDVLVSWTVVGGEDNWNQTRIWNANDGWGSWNYVNDTDSFEYEDLADADYFVEVLASSEYDDPSEWLMNVTFTIDTTNPVVVVELPFDEATNLTNFTVSWEYTDATDLSNTNLTLNGPVNAYLETDDDSTEVLISDITGNDPLLEGDYTLNVTVWDSATPSANHGYMNVSFSVGPVVQFVTPNEDDPWYTADGNFTIEWTVSLYEGVVIVDQDIVITNETTGLAWTIDVDVDEDEIPVFNVTGFNLTDGSYSVSVEVEDDEGFLGEDNESFAVDTEAPDVEFVAPDGELDAWYTNANDFDAVWMYETDPLGTPIDSQIVTINNGTVNMTLAVDPSELSVSVEDVWGDVLPDGNYTIYINATDIVGNWENESANFTVDTVPPEFEIIVPDEEEDANYFNDNNFTAEWVIEFDPLMTPIVSQVVTISNGTDSISASVAVDEDEVVVSEVWGSVLPDGEYTIDVNITDAAGNWYNETANFTVDTAGPTVEVTYPPVFINDVDINATWIVNGTGSPVVSVWLTLTNVTGDFSYGPFDVTGLSNIVLEDLVGSDLANGNWTLSFNVTDMAGNNAITDYEFVVDTVPPVVVITAPIEGALLNVTDVTVEWTAEDVGVVVSGIEHLYIRNDSGTWITLDASATSYVLTLDDGSHFIEVRAVDGAGNVYIDSVTITVDVTPPSVEITYPADGAMFSYNELTINWTGSDENGSGIAYFEVMVDDNDWVNVGLNLSYNVSGLLDGIHVITVRAVDNASNMNTSSVSITIDITDPWVNITVPVLDVLYTNVSDVRMNWTAVDNTTEIAYIHVWNDSSAFVNLTADNVTYLFVGLTNGTHVLHVQAFDSVGNSQEKNVTVVVDKTAPEVVITYPQDGQTVSVVPINATWMVIDASPIVKIEVAIDDGFYVDLPDLNTSHIFANVAAGNHQIFVRATDAAGNAGTDHVNFVVDAVGPVVNSHTPASGAFVLPDAVVKVNFSKAMNQSSVAFTGITGTMTWNAAGNEVTLAHAALTYATVYNIVVSGKDLAGNAVTGTGASWSFTVKTQVTGTVNNDKGEPIANATVTISQGGVTVAEGVTDAAGNFTLLVDGVGTYNVTMSAAGFQDMVHKDVALGAGHTNSFGPMSLTPNADYTLLIVGVIVVVAIVLAALFLMRRRPVVKK